MRAAPSPALTAAAYQPRAHSPSGGNAVPDDADLAAADAARAAESHAGTPTDNPPAYGE